MKLGICCTIEEAEKAKEIGFDYFECALSAIGQMADEAFFTFKQETTRLNFYPLAMNVMLPGTFQLTGESITHEEALQFLDKALARAKSVKTESVVFGSAGARNLPEGFIDRKRAYQQLVDFAKRAGELAGKHDIRLAIEPLSFEESNIINFVSEAMYVAERVNSPHVKILADYYHMVRNDESVSSLYAFHDKLEHCHIAEAKERAYPLPQDGQDYSPFFEALRNIKYEGKLSIEAGGGHTFADNAQASFSYLKKLL